MEVTIFAMVTASEDTASASARPRAAAPSRPPAPSRTGPSARGVGSTNSWSGAVEVAAAVRHWKG